ncbi:GIY-YIG nuclease family protein [Pseudopontixanthobacter vadosimaris]|uniref:GIY-YIG nuclease family protein n=1 Tax=Pseudopontixanthobacter vadosimaris TaxID=2726450 RepID=UPI001475A774|nr:GIY-YIG nuclease family protein [Pseudopontixanthobacter vadosimaris]
MVDLTDDELLAELGVEIEQQKARTYTPREERIIAGFEDIVRFCEEHGRAPQHGEDRDIFERLYAVRLDRLRALADCRELLAGLDKPSLLDARREDAVSEVEIDDDALLAQLGVEPTGEEDIRVLRHVPTAEERRAADEIALREKCEDFAKFKPLFDQVQQELETGARETRPFEVKAEIRPSAFFIVGGQTALVAEMGEIFTNPQGRSDARLRVIFDNGTQSNMLIRSLQRALNKDDAGRRITEPEAGPLFSGKVDEGDEASGIIYVLRSKSDHPVVAEHRDLVHKIGVTNMKVEKRIAGAHLQPTFLMANVEIVAQYRLFNINRTKLEKLIHRVFGAAQLDLEIPDRFGTMIKPREWFLVPLGAIDEAVERIRDGSIIKYRYDMDEARLVLFQ